MKMTTKEVEELKELLNKKQKIVIVPHRNPDGDALGSTLALYQYLKQLNKHTISLISPNNYPEFLQWLPFQEEIIQFHKETEKARALVAEATLIFTLDFNDLSRVGHDMQYALQGNKKATFVMIDHHQAPSDYAAYTYSDTSIGSTCQLLYMWLEQLGEANRVTKDMGTCLYTGIMTDSGSFRFPSTSSLTHRIVANLIDLGIDNAAIHNAVYDQNSEDRLRLQGVALQNLHVFPEYKTAYITLSEEELQANNFKKGDTEGFVNFGLSVKGIIFAVIFIENKDDGIIKISLRSKGDFNVNEFARTHFQGGGHNNAAGGKSDLTLDETVVNFVKLIENYKEELNK
jgi:phosphoesterase RecJ-like protein